MIFRSFTSQNQANACPVTVELGPWHPTHKTGTASHVTPILFGMMISNSFMKLIQGNALIAILVSDQQLLTTKLMTVYLVTTILLGLEI